MRNMLSENREIPNFEKVQCAWLDFKERKTDFWQGESH